MFKKGTWFFFNPLNSPIPDSTRELHTAPTYTLIYLKVSVEQGHSSPLSLEHATEHGHGVTFGSVWGLHGGVLCVQRHSQKSFFFQIQWELKMFKFYCSYNELWHLNNVDGHESCCSESLNGKRLNSVGTAAVSLEWGFIESLIFLDFRCFDTTLLQVFAKSVLWLWMYDVIQHDSLW